MADTMPQEGKREMRINVSMGSLAATSANHMASFSEDATETDVPLMDASEVEMPPNVQPVRSLSRSSRRLSEVRNFDSESGHVVHSMEETSLQDDSTFHHDRNGVPKPIQLAARNGSVGDLALLAMEEEREYYRRNPEHTPRRLSRTNSLGWLPDTPASPRTRKTPDQSPLVPQESAERVIASIAADLSRHREASEAPLLGDSQTSKTMGRVPSSRFLMDFDFAQDFTPENAMDMAAGKTRRERCSNPDSTKLQRGLWQSFYFTKAVIGHTGILVLLCFGILFIESFVLRYGVPKDYWPIRMVFETVFASFALYMPVYSLRKIFQRRHGSEKLVRLVFAPMLVLLCAFFVFLYTYLEPNFMKRSWEWRMLILAAYTMIVIGCAITMRSSGIKRLPLYICLAYIAPIAIIPLYMLLIGPALLTDEETHIIAVVILRAVVHPLLMEVITTVSRTVAIVSEDGINDDVMFILMCPAQIAKAFYGRILINNIHESEYFTYVLVAMSVVEILMTLSTRKRHRAARWLFYCIGCYPCRQGRSMSHRRRLELGEDDSIVPGGRPMSRTISVSEMSGRVNRVEAERESRIVAESFFTGIIYELSSIPLVALMFAILWDPAPSHAIKSVFIAEALKSTAIQLAFEIPTDIANVMILKWIRFPILKLNTKSDGSKLGVEAAHFVYAFLLIVVVFPMYSLWSSYSTESLMKLMGAQVETAEQFWAIPKTLIE